MFIIVPVIVATWQYRQAGMMISLPIAALGFILIAFIMPADAFNWYFYAVRGFVLLGICLVVGLVTWMLVEMMKAEQDKLSIANQKLAEQALIMEELAASRERNRLARELHDTLAHSISGATIQLQAVQTLINVDAKAAISELEDARAHLKDGLAESRRAIATLRDSSLEEHGLAKALEQEANKIGARSQIQVETKLEADIALTDTAEQAVFRIMSAAMNNVERHANASKMVLHIQKRPNGYRFKVQDDGQGFVVNPQQHQGRYGLVGMRERAQLIGANLEIESVVGKGSEVILTIPA